MMMIITIRRDFPFLSVDSFSDFGILPSSDAGYSKQCVLAASRGFKIP